MKKYNLLSIILLGITLVNCNGIKKEENTLFTFDITSFKAQYLPQDALSLAIVNTNSEKIDSVVYFSNDKKIAATKGIEVFKWGLKNQKLGYQNLKAVVYYDGENAQATARIELVSAVVPKLLKYKIIHTYPHDTTSFTQGLEFYKDTLYESTGLNGKSKLLKTDYKTGKIYKSLKLDDQYFGEGITFINNQLFQLTWQNKTGFIYDSKTWKLLKTFTYEKDIEGWGMTNDGTYIYQTDKTEKIWKMDPKTQKMIDYINVYSGSSKVKAINELEWIEGKIYTNVWTKDAIAVVNPSNGAVEGILDMSGLRQFLKVTPDDVLNGIAYNPKTKTIFVTGKNWNKIFEIIVFE
ncbi:glutaminyl-peptide cyclotransferase [Flavobacterium restrictum]|uniref:Glutaminyl-peptide cyclotransferase n=1 Tax=Flavobacterium restrictum TaxID=2594428 RepID=A0A553ECI8_9FLAO|nr:glutaminyl-peptide cyclotransferase [Flavobacterium restrictum]TRX42769.1 glutaminyl-peptide cyclotransferase [Flavobacterium restrictum]